MFDMPGGVVAAVSSSPVHGFTKDNAHVIRLLAGFGVEGDAHFGAKVQHRSRVARNPDQPNLRQVHLLQEELFDELRAAGHEIAAGAIGENVTTRGLDLPGLPRGTRLRMGADALVELTGLRNPCHQLDDFRKGLMRAVLAHDEAGNLIRKAGVMAIVIAGGEVRPGDTVEVELPPAPHHALAPV